MNYQQTLDFLFAQLPMFHRVGPAAYKPGLENTIRLMDGIGHPYQGMPCVHVAGTNGKGSTSHLLAAVLQCAGYKVGLYTSPHLKDFRERIRVNGAMIDRDFIVDFVAQHKDKWVDWQPSFFEITVALCFSYFSQQEIDIAIIETGLGGRLDSTNVIDPLLSVITNVSMDHMNLLGDTIEAIAFEKAGIIKAGRPVVLGPMSEVALKVMIAKAQSEQASVFMANDQLQHLFANCALKGDYQQQNFSTVGTAISVLRQLGYSISDQHVKDGATQVISFTGLQGRWQNLGEQPLVIADVAHNEDGIMQVLMQIEKTNFKKLHFVLGMVADKDVSRVLKLLPQHAVYYFCKANIPRGLEATQLQEEAQQFHLLGQSFQSVGAAYAAALANASPEDMVFIGGSIFTVAEVL